MKTEIISSRNYGIDALRIVSMVFIINLHTLYHGGGVANSEAGSFNYYFLTFLITLVYSGVDVFAIISGFVGYENVSGHRFAKFVELWFQVSFYSVLITLIFFIMYPGEIEIKKVLLSFVPFSSRMYWYFTSYAFVYILSPFINEFVKSIKSNTVIIKFAIAFGYLFLLLSHFQPGCFSIILLVYLYFLGAICRKFNLHRSVEPIKAFGMIIIFLFITWLWTVLITPYNALIGSLFLRYDSPSIIAIALLYVLTFANIEIKNIKLLKYIVPSVFSVYLINDHQILRKYIITNKFAWLSDATIIEVLSVLFIITAIFLLSTVIIDSLRRCIFRVFRIKTLSCKIETLFIATSVFLCNKFVNSFYYRLLSNKENKL